MAHTGKNKTPKTSAGAKGAGSGARGRQGATVERSRKRRFLRVATGTASTEKGHGRTKEERKRRLSSLFARRGK